MNNIQSFLTKHPRYQFSTQYAPVGREMNSVVGFFNYYDQVFRGSGIGVTLHLIFFDGSGRETAWRAIYVPPNAAVQFDARQEGIECDGMVAVAAVPDCDINAINAGRIQIRARVNTGFYVKWENNRGGRDLMHEWSPVQTVSVDQARHHVGFIRVQPEVEHGLILMNPVVAKDAESVPRLVIRESGKSSAIAEARLDPIPPMGTQVVRFSTVFPSFASLLSTGVSLVVDVVAENLSAPLTAEWHGQGDFHFHHI